MRKTIVSLAVLMISASANATTVQIHKKQAKPVLKEFVGKLKGEMQKAMKAGGPTVAMSVCSSLAPGIAKSIGDKHKVKISRTSLKLRNPANAPDKWELGVLKQFEKRKTAGEKVSSISHAAIIIVNSRKYFRMMKAIPTGQVCLKCHAEKVAPAVEAKLNKLYPGDKARGFKIGDIRGAVSIIKELN